MLVDELNGHCYMTGFGKSLTLEPGLNVLSTHTIPENYQNNSLFLLNYLQGTIKLKAAARNFKDLAYLLHREPRIFKIKGAAEFILYGLDRMPRDFFKMSITSSF